MSKEKLWEIACLMVSGSLANDRIFPSRESIELALNSGLINQVFLALVRNTETMGIRIDE